MDKPESPVTVDLLFEDEEILILYCAYHDPWTWGDFHAGLARDRELTRHASGRAVYRVVDLSATQGVPPGAVRHFSQAAGEFMRGSGITVFVTANPVLRALGKTMTRLFPRTYPRVRHAADLHEASALIERLTSGELI